jgi:hypothetical protein
MSNSEYSWFNLLVCSLTHHQSPPRASRRTPTHSSDRPWRRLVFQHRGRKHARFIKRTMTTKGKGWDSGMRSMIYALIEELSSVEDDPELREQGSAGYHFRQAGSSTHRIVELEHDLNCNDAALSVAPIQRPPATITSRVSDDHPLPGP